MPLPSLFPKITEATDLPSMLNVAFQTAIMVGAVLAMFRIAYAGWLYMGSDMWSKKGQAKEVFQNAIIGLLLLLAVYLILNQINPDILSLKIQPLPSSANPQSAQITSQASRNGF